MISFVSSSQLETFHRHHHYLSSFSFFSCVSWSSSPVVHRTNHIMHTTIVILLTFSFYPYVFLAVSFLSFSTHHDIFLLSMFPLRFPPPIPPTFEGQPYPYPPFNIQPPSMPPPTINYPAGWVSTAML